MSIHKDKGRMKVKILLTLCFIMYGAASVFGQNSVQTAVSIGDVAPDFTLTAHNGEKVNLSEAVKNSPVVIVFYRGYWCPFCANQLADLSGLLNKGEKTQLFAISIDPPEKSRELIKKIEKDGKSKVNYLLLFDAGAKTIDEYRLRDPRYDGEKVDGIPYPTVYVINKERQIVWARLDKDYKKRPTNEEIRVALDKLK
jgi:peroxiredoxin